jgi:hypothetical protein
MDFNLPWENAILLSAMEKGVTYLFLITGMTMAIFAVLLVTARERTNVSYWLGASPFASRPSFPRWPFRLT